MALIDCPECGGKVSDKAESCPSCGYVISEIKCEECGKMMKKGTKVCPSCGCPVNATEKVPITAATVAVPAPNKSYKKIIIILIAVIVFIAAAAIVLPKVFNKPAENDAAAADTAENTEIITDIETEEMDINGKIEEYNSIAKTLNGAIDASITELVKDGCIFKSGIIEGEDFHILMGGWGTGHIEDFLGENYTGYSYGEFEQNIYKLYYVLWSDSPIPDEYKRYIAPDEQEELFNKGICIGCYGEEPEEAVATAAAETTTASDDGETIQIENQEFTFKIAIHNYDSSTKSYNGFKENELNGYYTGAWRNGKPNGGGTFGQIYENSGTTITGLWTDGELDSFTDAVYKSYYAGDDYSYVYSYTGDPNGLQTAGGTGTWEETWNDKLCRSFYGECKGVNPTGNGEMTVYGQIFDKMFDDGSYIVQTGEFYDGSFINGTYKTYDSSGKVIDEGIAEDGVLSSTR